MDQNRIRILEKNIAEVENILNTRKQFSAFESRRRYEIMLDDLKRNLSRARA